MNLVVSVTIPGSTAIERAGTGRRRGTTRRKRSGGPSVRHAFHRHHPNRQNRKVGPPQVWPSMLFFQLAIPWLKSLERTLILSHHTRLICPGLVRPRMSFWCDLNLALYVRRFRNCYNETRTASGARVVLCHWHTL